MLQSPPGFLARTRRPQPPRQVKKGHIEYSQKKPHQPNQLRRCKNNKWKTSRSLLSLSAHKLCHIRGASSVLPTQAKNKTKTPQMENGVNGRPSRSCIAKCCTLVYFGYPLKHIPTESEVQVPLPTTVGEGSSSGARPESGAAPWFNCYAIEVKAAFLVST